MTSPSDQLLQIFFVWLVLFSFVVVVLICLLWLVLEFLQVSHYISVLTVNRTIDIFNEREDLNTVSVHKDSVQAGLISC